MKIKFYGIKNPKVWCTTSDDVCPSGYTDIQPLGYQYYPTLPIQHFDTENQEWVLDDDCLERQYIDSVKWLESLKIRRVLRTLESNSNPDKTQEDDLDELFDSNPLFLKEWNISPNNLIYMEDPTVIQALEYIQIDIDEVKRLILGVVNE